MGGVDINTYPTHSLRKEIALVGPEIPFLMIQLKQHLSQAKLCSPDQLVLVCEAVGLDEFVNRYKDAYQSQLVNQELLSVSGSFNFP